MLDGISNIFGAIGEVIFSLLPDSPFTSFLDAMQTQDWLRWLNWLIPIGTFISIGTAWLTCVSVYYLYSMILRYIRAVE